MTSVSSVASEKKQLRRELRARRRALSACQQRLAALGLTRQIVRSDDYPRMKRVALYWALDGEINVSPLMQRLHADGKSVYLPVMNPLSPRLRFGRWTPDQPMKKNRFGIPEPAFDQGCLPWSLDWLLMPLVGFDDQGGRLGMGGGFYDRTFADAGRWPKQPKRLGVAHECQRLDAVPKEPWDLPLIRVVTDQRWYGAS